MSIDAIGIEVYEPYCDRCGVRLDNEPSEGNALRAMFERDWVQVEKEGDLTHYCPECKELV